jgi:hypothetical protein
MRKTLYLYHQRREVQVDHARIACRMLSVKLSQRLVQLGLANKALKLQREVQVDPENIEDRVAQENIRYRRNEDRVVQENTRHPRSMSCPFSGRLDGWVVPLKSQYLSVNFFLQSKNKRKSLRQKQNPKSLLFASLQGKGVHRKYHCI